MEEIKQESCACEHQQLIKKGFNGTLAVLCFIISSVSFLIITNTLQSNQTPGESQSNNILYYMGGLIIATSFFAGTYRMNNVYSVCTKCGKAKLIYQNETLI